MLLCWDDGQWEDRALHCVAGRSSDRRHPGNRHRSESDLANLLLTFPELRSEDFAPWVNEEDATWKNLSVAQELETMTSKPTKANIAVKLLALAWAPYWQDDKGQMTPAWE